MKKLAALLLICGAAHAQTYDVSVSFSNVMGAPGTFDGSFTLANGLMSAISVSDPTAYGGVFNSGTDTAGAIQLQDQYDARATDVLGLSFNMDGSGIEFIQSPNSTGLFICPPEQGMAAEVCSISIKAQAPEMGLEFAPLVLLLGTLAVIRRRSKPTSNTPSSPRVG